VGAAISELVAPTAIRDLEIVGMNAYWVDERGRLWRLDLAGRLPIEMVIDEKLDQIAPSPDGRWIALRAENHLLLHDRTAPAAPPLDVLFGKIRDLDWSADGTHLAALVELGEPTERQVVDVSFESVPQIVHRVRVGNRSAVAISGGRMYTIGPMGVGVASRSETTSRKQLVGEPLGVHESIDGVVVAAAHGGLAILTDDGDHSILVPSGRLEAVDASAKSPYVLGMTDGRMLVWNMTDLLPRRLAVRASTIERFVGNARVLAAYFDAPAEWIDLATGKPKPIAQLPAGLVEIAGSQDGRAACLVDAGHQGRLIVEDREPVDLGPVDVALFAGTQLVIATEAGTIQRIDIATRQRTVLAARPAKLVHLTASRGNPTWLAAAYADGTLWRTSAAGPASTTVIAGVPPKLVLQPDGTLVFPEGRMLKAWRPTGAVEPLVELPKPIAAIGLAGPDRAVAFVDDGTAFLVHLDAPNRFSDPFDVDSRGATMSPDSGLIVVANRGTIELIDPLVPHRWTLAASSGLTFNAAQISGDGRFVLARRLVTDREKKDVEARDVNVLLAWRLVSPNGPEETARWLDQMTNAVVDLQTTNLAWQ
jgi:hypothetical protein